jgi:hypothetical protein
LVRVIDTATIEYDTLRETLEHLAENLRLDDIDELKASLGPDVDPFWALFESWELSTSSYLILDRTGLPIAIFGVAPHPTDRMGIAWMLGTDGIIAEGRDIARKTRQYVQELHRDYPLLFANVDARNAVSMGWLERAGFVIADADPAWGPEERLFIQYVRAK